MVLICLLKLRCWSKVRPRYLVFETCVSMPSQNLYDMVNGDNLFETVSATHFKELNFIIHVSRAGHTMDKALLIALFTISCRIASGQFCLQLPQESTIFTDFNNQLGVAVDQSRSYQASYLQLRYLIIM